jgi:hypothetical protein
VSRGVINGEGGELAEVWLSEEREAQSGADTRGEAEWGRLAGWLAVRERGPDGTGWGDGMGMGMGWGWRMEGRWSRLWGEAPPGRLKIPSGGGVANRGLGRGWPVKQPCVGVRAGEPWAAP